MSVTTSQTTRPLTSTRCPSCGVNFIAMKNLYRHLSKDGRKECRKECIEEYHYQVDRDVPPLEHQIVRAYLNNKGSYNQIAALLKTTKQHVSETIDEYCL